MKRARTALMLLCGVILLCALALPKAAIKEWKNRQAMPYRMTPLGVDTSRFESQGKYHSAHLTLDSVGRFTYHIVYEVGFDIALGQYVRSGDTLTLIGDSARTFEAVLDTGFYKALFAYSTPDPYRLDSVQYTDRNDTLHLIAK